MNETDKATQPVSDGGSLSGRGALAYLAQIYQQIYLRPGADSAETYKGIALRGEDAPTKDLSHFIGNDLDSLVFEDTPAGVVPVLTLHERADFELFLQIVANRCTPCEIPATQGASILDGLPNWQKIRRHRETFLQNAVRNGDPAPDWSAEFRRFTADKRNYQDALIILSAGPYSNISADRFGLTEADWLAHSHAIRKAHECTHFLCRRLYPEKKDAVWDELVADAVGIYAAFGTFDPAMEEAFLGISNGRYIGGRLENYDAETSPDALAATVHAVLSDFCAVFRSHPNATPFELAIALEEQKEALWG